jgi:RND family efflux transporter MFP subunit
MSQHPRNQPASLSRQARPRRTLRWVGLAAVVVALLAAVAGILGRQRQEAEVKQWTDRQAVPTVAAITPARGVAGAQTVLPGDVEAWYEAPLYARVSGYLKNWYFDYGAHVKKGDLLAEIDAPDLDAQYAAAQAALVSAKALVNVRQAEKSFAETTYERWRDSPKGVVSLQEQESKRADYGTAVANLNAALANVNTAQGNVDRLAALESFKRITVPFDGVVTARETDIGALINAGSGVGGGSGPELFRVADVHEMRVFVQVPQQMSAGIRSGLNATLYLPQYPEKTFKAVVATTSEAIRTASRTMVVELHAENPDGLLPPGAYAEVHFELPGNPNMVRIPTSALLFREHGLEVALIGPDNKITLRPVTLGRNLGTEVEVLKGLTPSDHIVNSPPDSLAAGDVVRLAGEPGKAGQEAALEPASEKN